MNRKEAYEQVIDFKDMLFYILYRWRSVLIAAIIAGCLVTGYAFFYNTSVLPEKRTELQAQIQEQMQVLAEIKAQGEGQEQNSGKAAEETQKQIDQLEGQLDELEAYHYGKCCVIGFLVGFFGMSVCYALVYVFSDRMRGEREMLERYGYRLLGTFPRRRRKKLLSGLDRFLERKEGISGQITEEEAHRIVSVNITNLAKEGGLFLVTGTVEAGRLQKLVEAIVPQLRENVELMVGADMNINARTLEMLAECDGVILVEERDRSLVAKVHKEHESIAALGKPVVGYVMM